MKRTFLPIGFWLLILVIFSCGKEEPTAPQTQTNEEQATTLEKGGSGSGDPAVLAMMNTINEQLASQGLNLAVESIEFFTIGNGRPSNRIHQQQFRWVPNDPRRAAQGEDITYIVDQTYQGTASGVSAAQTEADIDASLTTWNDEHALRKVALVKRADPGVDISIFDEFFPTNLPFGDVNPDEPAAGNPFLGDIVDVGWYPRGYFEAAGGPGGGNGILAFSVSFIFTDNNGVPTDINGDNHLDTALNEVYFNNTFGKAGEPRQGNPWTSGQQVLPTIDIQTVSLHENGHSLGLGHFGPPPSAVMNPVYAGPNITPDAPDLAGMNAVWGSWPNP